MAAVGLVNPNHPAAIPAGFFSLGKVDIALLRKSRRFVNKAAGLTASLLLVGIRSELFQRETPAGIAEAFCKSLLQADYFNVYNEK